ncbi:hypothetical protein Nepgr_017368 [Nepenthes gracilis]|uniref:Uncharacterized protein n=1 Tax=Nepenthes gracilis TaxID=150966 RepID=A0AAD3SS93_NEPGR|nr:hypothetical protein Nepgr_017368 [Nepenthes gracilis]
MLRAPAGGMVGDIAEVVRFWIEADFGAASALVFWADPVTATSVGGSAARVGAELLVLAISSSLLCLVVCPCWLNFMLVFGVGVMQQPVAPAGGILGVPLLMVGAPEA